uniref:Serine palmitoyltransferase 1 n=1 Tax=Panagrellus redivivus TaxID=6233 RepID=A0A7E4WCC0_PANRE
MSVILAVNERSVTELFGVDVIDIDMIMASLENAFATTGGFCAGRSYVVGHQRLSGLGYCFSASLPPLLATAASEAIRIIQAEPDRLQRLQNNAIAFHKGLLEAVSGSGFAVQADANSPLKHVVYTVNADVAGAKVDAVVEALFDNASIVAARSRYLDKDEFFPVQPSAKLLITSEHSTEEIAQIVAAVKNAVANQ